MPAETIQDFLVGLGWKVDSAGERRFTEALSRSKVAAVGVAAALAGVVATIAKVAESYETLYYQSQRAGASVANIKAMGYALSQVGGSAAGAASSLEAIGSFLRSSPGSESFIQRLGVQTRDAHGGLRDTADMLGELGTKFRAMPYYRAHAYANVLGIDERTLQALIRGTGQFAGQLKAMYRAAGLDSEQAAKGSAVFMQQLRGFGAALQVLRDKVALSLEHGVGGDIDRLRRLLVANFGRISAAIVGMAKFVTTLGWAFVQLAVEAVDIVDRLIDWFDGLDRGTRRWIGGIGLLTTAWYVLNKGFLASPVGKVVALGLAIAGLVQDYEVWKAGGKSLIDWKEWEPAITAALDSIGKIQAAFKDMAPVIKGYLSPLLDFLKHELIDGMKEAVADLADLVQAADDVLHGRWGSAKGHYAAIAARTVASGKDDAARLGTLVGQEDAVAGNPLAHAENALSRGWRFITGQTGRAESTGYSILKGLGLDRTHAIAMLGNMEQESNGLDPRAIGPDGKHFGLMQWSNARADRIKAQTGIDVRTAGYADQLKAAVWETTMGGERNHARAFYASTDLAGASGRFATDIERSGEHPGMKGFDNRIRNSLAMDHRLRYADQASAGGTGGSPRIHAPMTTTINVNGTAHPNQVAQSVVRKQDWVNASFVRNMGPLTQ